MSNTYRARARRENLMSSVVPLGSNTTKELGITTGLWKEAPREISLSERPYNMDGL